MAGKRVCRCRARAAIWHLQQIRKSGERLEQFARQMVQRTDAGVSVRQRTGVGFIVCDELAQRSGRDRWMDGKRKRGNRDVGNLQIRLAAPFTVTGTVDWGDLPNRNAAILLLPADGQSAIFGPPMAGSSGTISLRAATAGKQLIVPQPGPGYYPVSVLLGGQEVLGKPVDLFPGATFRVAYKAATGSVHGTVENGSGATVFLIPDNVQTLGFGRMLMCKTDGTFDMSGVPPGDYFVTALDQMQRTLPIADAAWLARVVAIGTRVSVGQTAVSVRLKMNPLVE